MNKKIIIISLIILIFSISTVSANENATYDSLSVTPDGNSFDDIQQTIDNAKNGDIIELDGNYTSNSKLIDINKEVTIQSTKNTATLDGKRQSSIFNINADKITLKNLIVKNSVGFAIKSSSQNITYSIINCTFIGNGNDYTGGVIFHASGNTLNIINSTFTNNEVSSSGGAIYSVNGEINIINSSFINNRANEGGAIHSKYTKLTIINSSFNNNQGVSGGAIYAYGTLLEIYDSVFINNVADYGGAVNADVKNIVISRSNFTKNSANKDGGAIYVKDYIDRREIIEANLNISYSIFDSNNNGNAIYAYVYNVDVKNSTFKSNTNDLYVEIGTLINVNNTINSPQVVNSKAKLVPGKSTLYYGSGKFFTVRAENEKTNFIDDLKIKIKIGSGSNAKELVQFTVGGFPYSYFPLSNLPAGKYKITISLESKYFDATPIKTTITIKKAKTIVKAKKVTAKYKKSKKFTVKVKNKKSGLPLKNIKIKIKVFTGKKAKKYILKTTQKGTASFNTNKLKKGYHKVIITSKNKNYDIYKKSAIVIK